MWRALLVEDQAIVREGLKVILEQDDRINVVKEAANGQEAIDQLEKHMIDFVMMDVRMPVMNGIEATRIIKQRWPNIKILILTTFNDDEYVMQTLREGASGFMLKTADGNKLIEAVHSTMQGGMTIHDDAAAKVMPRLLERGNTDQHQRDYDDGIGDVALSDRELAIMRLIGAGKTNKEISETLYLSIGTVKNYLTQILQKTGLGDRTKLAIYAVRRGFTDE